MFRRAKKARDNSVDSKKTRRRERLGREESRSQSLLHLTTELHSRRLFATEPLLLPPSHGQEEDAEAVTADALLLQSSLIGLEHMSEPNQSQPLPQIVPQHESTTTDVATTELENALPLLPPTTSAPAAKIPLRPRKIRKVSPDHKPSPTENAKPAAAAKASKSRSVGNKTLPLSVPRITARSLSCDGEVETALRHLRSVDPILAPLIDLHPLPTFDTFHTPFLALTKSILYQQLAYKAGTSIYTRFIALCGGEPGVVPETVLTLNPQQLRQIGVSGRKASYLHDLARKYQNGILSDTSIVNMDDKSLFTMLTMVNGIGSWSVHMFMIFSLHRPDVLPINDLGIRKGVQLLYGLEELPRPSQMDHLCEKWRPYRSVASWYLWRFVEARGSPSSAVAVAVGGSSLQQQQQHHHHQHQHEEQPQLVDPINSILNLGAGNFDWGKQEFSANSFPSLY